MFELVASINVEQALTQVLANIAVLMGIGGGFYAVKKARKEAKKSAIAERGDILDGATGYTQLLMTRITELETKVEGMQRKQDEINEARLHAEREAAEWKIRFENEHELRIASEMRATEAEAQLKITGYRRRSDAEIIVRAENTRAAERLDHYTNDDEQPLDDEPKI